MQRGGETALRPRPLDQRSLARVMGQRGPEGRNGLLQPRRAAFTLAEGQKRVAQLVLVRRPIRRPFGARYKVERRANNTNCLLERGIVAVLLTLAPKIERLIDAVGPSPPSVPALDELGCGLEVGGRRAVLEPGPRNARAH